MRADVQVDVRRVRPEDWRVLRDLRLEALADTPIAYCERLEDARAQPDEEWQQRAARGAEGGDAFQALAFDGDRAVATALCFEADGVHWLGAVFVASSHRGGDLLRRLTAAAAEWAASRGATELLLEVHESNPRAQAAYRRLGFVATGRRRPYPLDRTTSELEMSVALPLS